MAEEVEIALEEVLSSLSVPEFKLRGEQRDGILKLASSGDLLAVLPTGFGKSLIFQLLVRVKERLLKKASCVVVICPLKSIVQDQICEATSMGLTATSFSEAKLEDIQNVKYQLVFASAEEVLDKQFLSALKNSSIPLHQNLAAIIVDESHTLETWTGKRSSKKDKNTRAFRESFGRLAVLRSFCKEGTPVGALTGTADETTQDTIKKSLCLRADALTIYVSPNRSNIRFCVKKVRKAEQLDELRWLVKLMKEKGINTPKTIVFCNTMNDIAAVVNFLFCELGNSVFYPQYSKTQDNCLIGIFHSNSWQSSKDRVLQCFKDNGVKRVVIATTALCMGVNFPDVRYIINWGPARTILDQHQEAGRAGRDGKAAHVIVIYHGQQAGPCEKEVKEFVHAKGCLRVAAYQTLDPLIQPVEPLHDCCSFCTTICKCAGSECDADMLPFEVITEENKAHSDVNRREVTSQDRQVLKEALNEVLANMQGESMLLDRSSSHGFSTHLIEEITKNCETIFTLEDITSNYPVFSISNARRILELIQEVFMDIPNLEENLVLLSSSEKFLQDNFGTDVRCWFDFDNLTLGGESDSELSEI